MHPTRRSLLFAPTAALFAFGDDTLQRLQQLDPTQGGPDDEVFWRQVRSHFDADPTTASFNHAGLSPSPRAVRTLLVRELARMDVEPSRVLWRLQEHELDPVRARLAKLLGYDVDQLALTPNATWGLHTTILGLPMREGDEIVVTAHEYSRAFTAVEQRRRRDGIRVVEVPLAVPPEAPERVAADVLAAVTAKTRLVVLSQATYLTGQLLPIAAVATALRSRGVPVLVDGAHGVGLLPATFGELGGAFYTACLHKWLMGPVGTGVFVVEPAWIERLWPLCAADAERDRRIGKFEEYGTRALAPFLALAAALDFHDWLGLPRKAARLENRRQDLVATLDGIAGLDLLTGPHLERSAAIVAVAVPKCDPKALCSWLWREHRIHTTSVTTAGLQAIRLSPHVFTSDAEIERLAAALRTAARDGI
ncbi:MAG: aminotransferase class V-fold PLP-dependent enzyme [Planctomycetes bacterium]|nr:aminotransferase class V-fold PLP-dependent enzyme [Planctomycetota bacterium]